MPGIKLKLHMSHVMLPPLQGDGLPCLRHLACVSSLIETVTWSTEALG